MEMAESRADEIDRISCEEEERISRGDDIRTYFSVDAGQPDQAQTLMGQRIRQANARSGPSPERAILLNLRYIPAARLVHVNTKWRSQHNEGFPLGLVSGDWRSSIPEPDTTKESFRSVKLWTSNLADAIHIEPIQPLGLDADGVVTLQYALKRAIELETQVEPNELGVISVGDPEAPNILLYEAAEGSLGILSRFVEDPGLYRRVVEQAIALCRYHDPGYQGPASYDDLLSYYNQRDHKRIDRWLIRAALDKLRLCDLEIQSNPAYDDYDRQYHALLRAIDPNSEMERQFLDYLHQNGLRLPDAAQKAVDGLYVRPDFDYAPRFWVFCDGTPHDRPEVREADEAKRQAILARGDEVWVWNYREELEEVVCKRRDVFQSLRR